MSITVGDNFSYQGAKPLDSRFQFASVADMKAYPEASLYNGCPAYVTAVKKNYQYDSSNTVDATTGRWREFSTGGGGGGSVPAGGTTGQALLKKSDADEDVEWGNVVDANAYSINDGLENALDTGDKIPYYNISTQRKQNITWDNLKASLKSYFDTLYSKLTRQTPASGGTTLSAVYTGDMYNWNTGSTWYGTCSTSASTTAKSVTLARGTLNFTAGAKIAVKFTYNNTASAPTLTINNTTKNIKYIDADGNVSTPLIWWNAGDVVEFTYDGTQWLMQPTMQMLFSGQGTKIPRESIYSTTEKIVGCWTDGRPVYQKTIETTTPTTSASGTMVTSTVSIGASIRQVVKLQAHTVRNNGYFAIPLTIENSNRLAFSVKANAASTDPNKLSISNSVAEWSNLPLYVTIQYTKTTDAANSFNYGDPNEYSTTEKIVGTWIDGKPLYQKTISCGALPNTTTKTVAHGISGTYRIRNFYGYAYDGSHSPVLTIALPHVSTTLSSQVDVHINGTNIEIITASNKSQYTESYVTLQYTKS